MKTETHTYYLSYSPPTDDTCVTRTEIDESFSLGSSNIKIIFPRNPNIYINSFEKLCNILIDRFSYFAVRKILAGNILFGY